MFENNKNSGKIKIQNCCEPCIMGSSVSNALYLVHFKITDSNFSDTSKYVLTKGHSGVFNNFSQIWAIEISHETESGYQKDIRTSITFLEL